MGERDKIKGMIEAHNILMRIVKSRPKRKWWQTGVRQVAELEALCAVSNELYDEIARRQDEECARRLSPKDPA